MRMCVVTREKMPKKDLIRVVYFNDTFTVDKSGMTYTIVKPMVAKKLRGGNKAATPVKSVKSSI